MKIEYWKPIPGYEEYEVSNLGRVRSLKFGKMKILKQYEVNGYLRVSLYKDRKQKWFFVHRLVAMAFIPNTDKLPMINHKDECKTNNIPENLEWCDASYNNSYGTLPERQSQKQLNDPIKSKKVYQYTLYGVLVRVWSSVNEVARNGFSLGHVAACCRGERKSHRGYRWSYIPITSF